MRRFDGTSWSDFGGAIGVPISAFWAPNSGQAVVALLGPTCLPGIRAGRPLHGTADPGGGPPGQLRAEWGTSINDFWLVGDGGRVVWYDSTAGYVVESPGTTENLDAVTGTSSSNVWVGGTNGYIAHWDGSGWTDCSLSSLETVTSLWISADRDRVRRDPLCPGHTPEFRLQRPDADDPEWRWSAPCTAGLLVVGALGAGGRPGLQGSAIDWRTMAFRPSKWPPRFMCRVILV